MSRLSDGTTDAAAIAGVTVQGGMITGPATEMPMMPEMPAGVEFKVTLTNLTTGVPARRWSDFFTANFCDTWSWVFNWRIG